MRLKDPHVARLIYRIEHSKGFKYDEAEPLDHAEPEFRVRIANRHAAIEMIEHFATAEEARALVQPFLRTWEIDAGIKRGPGVLRFAYEGAEIVDRKPAPRSAYVSSSVIGLKETVGHVLGLGRYPEPPAGFAFSSEADAMFDRFSRYKAGQTLLGQMADFCLTVLVGSARGGQRSAAAKKYRIDSEVLNTLGDLAAEKGGPLHARKAKGLRTPYTPPEIAWIEAVIKALIRRVSEVAHGPATVRETITWENLPDLPEASKKVRGGPRNA